MAKRSAIAFASEMSTKFGGFFVTLRNTSMASTIGPAPVEPTTITADHRRIDLLLPQCLGARSKIRSLHQRELDRGALRRHFLFQGGKELFPTVVQGRSCNPKLLA